MPPPSSDTECVFACVRVNTPPFQARSSEPMTSQVGLVVFSPCPYIPLVQHGLAVCAKPGHKWTSENPRPHGERA